MKFVRLYCFLFLLFICQVTQSQTVKIYTVHPGEKITDVIPIRDQYLYSGFQNGEVLFKNGYKSKALLNYYIISQEILFVTNNRDTLAVSNPAEINNVQIGSDLFFYEGNRFVKQDTIIGEAVVAVSHFFVTKDIKKLSAFGSATDGGVDSYELFLPSTNHKLAITPQVLTRLAIGQSLYIGDKYKHFLPVTKKNILSFFPEQQRVLRKYLNEHPVNFYSRKDVIDLMVYMNQTK